MLAPRTPEKARIFHGDGWIDCALLHGRDADGRPEDHGRRVIEGYTATTWVPPGWTPSWTRRQSLLLRTQ